MLHIYVNVCIHFYYSEGETSHPVIHSLISGGDADSANGVVPQISGGHSVTSDRVTSDGVSGDSGSSTASERKPSLLSGAGGVDAVDGGDVRVKKGKKRPLSGYDLPEITVCGLVGDLGHQDDRYMCMYICWKLLGNCMYLSVEVYKCIHTMEVDKVITTTVASS